MSEPMSRIEQLRAHVDPAWSEAHVAHELQKLESAVAARQRARMLAFSAGLSFAAIALCVVWWNRDLTVPGDVSAPVATQKHLEPTPAKVVPSPDVDQPLPKDNAQAVAALDPSVLDAGVSEPSSPSVAGSKRMQKSKVVTLAAGSWRKLAEEGRYKEAYAALPAQSLRPSALDVPGLLLAADSARLSGHPREAVPYYRAIFERSPSDSRAHLAAFTLGRTLLHELNDPRAAADAFARAYALAPKGPLAEEALAREVESWSRAGDGARAKERAELYLHTFPSGRRLQEVKRAAKLP